MKNSSFFGIGASSGNGVSVDNPHDPRRTDTTNACGSYGSCTIEQNPEIKVENVLVMRFAGGYLFRPQAGYMAQKEIYNSVGWDIGSLGTWRDNTEQRVDSPPAGVSSTPDIGPCRVWIPDSSSLKGKGRNGEDVGANILYAYENGALTDKKLWNAITGEWVLKGAIVPGINDIPGQSLFDVHKRLNVGLAYGCPFPAGYANDTAPMRGDLDSSGTVDLADVRLLIEMIVGQTAPNLSTADLNADGKLTLADIRELITILITP